MFYGCVIYYFKKIEIAKFTKKSSNTVYRNRALIYVLFYHVIFSSNFQHTSTLLSSNFFQAGET